MSTTDLSVTSSHLFHRRSGRLFLDKRAFATVAASFFVPLTTLSIPLGPIGLQLSVLALFVYALSRLSARWSKDAFMLVVGLVAVCGLNLVAHGVDLKTIYFFLTTVVIGFLVLIAMYDPREARFVFLGILSGIVFSALFGLAACPVIGCGFGSDPSFFQMVNSYRLYGFNAESSVLAPQIIALITTVFVFSQSGRRWSRLGLIGILLVALAYTRSSQLAFLMPLAVAAWMLQNRRLSFMGYWIFLSLVSFSLFVPLILSLLSDLIALSGGVFVLGRDLQNDILASALIRFASIDAGWGIFLENWTFGIGFDRNEIHQRVLQFVPNYAKFGVDNYPLARSLEFGIFVLSFWFLGFLKMLQYARYSANRDQRAFVTFFIVLTALSPFSSGYLGVYYYVIPVAFFFLSRPINN
ncbi:O-antigen ligase family protein [Leisingera daeponensis]|uniref:O-antigen ligase family protein n=1 Tax=Leisingera daeponensis TaxID=405746 RepID=UPI001C97FEC9|nr:O-antigen ligase family protein [Leisingera daeponensis]MBY6059428.1 O-antigen ligase family protein [Leisingera daeponensis]